MSKNISIELICERCYTTHKKRVSDLSNDTASVLMRQIQDLGWSYVGEDLLCPKCSEVERNLTNDLLDEKEVL